MRLASARGVIAAAFGVVFAAASAAITACASAQPATEAPAAVQQLTQTPEATASNNAEPTTPASPTRRVPIEIATGYAHLLLQPVEQSVPPEEVAHAVGALIAARRLCVNWPSLWLESAPVRGAYIVRFDLMARDWGEESATGGEQRMDDFVAAGFMTKQPRNNRAAVYTLTQLGAAALQGGGSDGRPYQFCGLTSEHLVEVTRLEWGQFPCGNLRAHFTYAADGWPNWASTPELRSRIASDFDASGTQGSGVVSLRRVWRRELGSPRVDGELQSACYDTQHQHLSGDDMDLHAAAP